MKYHVDLKELAKSKAEDESGCGRRAANRMLH